MVKNPPANAEDIRDMDSLPGLGRSPEQRSLKAIVHRVEKSRTQLKRLSTEYHMKNISCGVRST